MKKPFEQIIEIPENIEVSLEGNLLKVKGPEGENSREFKLGKINFKIQDKKIILSDKKATKREKKTINTTVSHINNMLKGVQEKFVYTLKVASSHFPMTVKVEGNKAEIKNFLGEKTPRHCKIPEGAEVEVKKNDIVVKSVDREIAGQAAANFEKATRISNRDRRVFQDGIYITSKAGKEIE
jgi:large subunit ribosomal protein L6